MFPKLEETIYLDFTTSSPTTGAAADADTTPTCEVFEDATDTAIITPTVVKRTGKTGNYRIPIACTAANGFEAGKSYNVIASATVGAVAGKARVGSFQVRTRSVDDILPTTTYVPQTGDSYAVVSHTDYGNAKLVRSTTPANTLDVSATGEAGLDFNNVKQAASPTTLTNVTVPNVTLVATTTSVTNDVGITQAAADKTWLTTSRSLTTFGSLVADVATAVWVAASRTLTAFGFSVAVSDKTGFELTAGDKEDIAERVESHLLDEGDSQMLINAIVGAIGNTNIDQTVLVAAIRADLERGGGNLNTLLTRLTSQRATNLDYLDVSVQSRMATFTYTAPLDALGIRNALGLGSANLDTQLADLPTVAEFEARTLVTSAYAAASALQVIDDLLDTEVAALLTIAAAIQARTDLIPDDPASAGAVTLADNSITAASITAAAANKLADHARRRTQANVEASSDGDALSLKSHYGEIQMSQQGTVTGPTTLTVYQTNTTTILGTRTLTTNDDASPISGVS